MPLPSIRRSFDPEHLVRPTPWHGRPPTTLAIIGLMAFAGWAPSAARADEVSIPEFEPCQIGSGVHRTEAECLSLARPIDSAEPHGATVGLNIARLPATGRRSRPDPLVLLAGGPGQAATEAFPPVLAAFAAVRRDRDLLLIDQRGTGGSHRLDCPAIAETASLEPDLATLADESANCLRGFDVDVRHFTTTVAAEDLDAIRRALGVERWNLYGVSYGTRLALQYLRRHRGAVRAVVLDGVLPPGAALVPDIALHAQRTLDLIFERCGASAACNERFPTIGERTTRLLARLDRDPVTVDFEDVGGGRDRTIEFGDAHLAVVLRLLSYTGDGAALLPSMLSDAIERDYFGALARQAMLQIESLDRTIATGMHQAVVCTEDAPGIDPGGRREALQDTYLGTQLLDALIAACAVWPIGTIDPDFHEPVASDVPTLLLSGEADPVTPPDYAERALSSLPNGRHVVNPGQGHVQVVIGCMPDVIAQFYDTAKPDELSLECLDRARPPAFFLDANGPLP